MDRRPTSLAMCRMRCPKQLRWGDSLGYREFSGGKKMLEVGRWDGERERERGRG
jgi:hypothetical protein